jgi:hypothetical protein
MSPQAAVEAYRTYLMPFANRASLGAPAVTNGGSGLPWLKEFLRLCTGCKIDFVPIHWYDSASNDAYLKLYVNQAYKAAGGREIWITEVYSLFHSALLSLSSSCVIQVPSLRGILTRSKVQRKRHQRPTNRFSPQSHALAR